jgi:hypothetical protein
MPRLRLHWDRAHQRVWVTLDGQRLVPLRQGDRQGLKAVTTWLVDAQVVSAAEAAALHGVRPRTVKGYQTTYAARGNSADLVDRRRFNRGQQTDYRMEAHKSALVRCVTLNLVRGEPNSERRVAEQMGMDDRTVGRHLHASGWRAAEEAGLAEEVAAYLHAERQRAYWAGVAGQPLTSLGWPLHLGEWQTPQPGRAGVSLGVAHLACNGVYASLKRLLVAAGSGASQALRTGHNLLVYLLHSGGARLSQAKHTLWSPVTGLLSGCQRVSATALRRWLVARADEAQKPVTVPRSDGQTETISRLRDYQEEAVAQRRKAGLIQCCSVYLDDYVNTVYRQEPLDQAKHGVWNRVVKAFRRHIVQDTETGHAVTCPLGPSDVTPLAVLEQVVPLVEGGLDRVAPGQKVARLTVDRWWSARPVFRWVLNRPGLTLLTWGKDIKSVREALATVREEDLKAQPLTAQVTEAASGQVVEKVVGYRLDTELTLADLETPVRGVVDWDGEPDSPKRVRLVVGEAAGSEGRDTPAVVDDLRFRQRVEILLKQLQRRVHWSAFGGGEAQPRAVVVASLDDGARQRLTRNRQQVATRLANDQARRQEVEKELDQVRQGQAPSNGLKLGVRDLKKLSQELQRRIARAAARLEELDAGLEGLAQDAPPPSEPTADLDLTREAILTQLKLDVFTAQETLVDDFIEAGLKPVLCAEAEQQAVARRQQGPGGTARSTAKGREGQSLCIDVEELYRIKLANLERETILTRLLNQPGEFVRHKQQRILLTVAERFPDRRMQAAYERYCLILNQRDIRVPMDGGEPWRLLFTYHLDAPSSLARFK